MAEIDSLGANYYYSGVQNASNETIKRNQKKDETQKTGSARKIKFGEILKGEEKVQSSFATEGFPPEIADMSVEEAGIYLADAVSIAGNSLSENLNQQNLDNFKKSVSQFIRFVVSNNYQINAHRKKDRLGRDKMTVSRTTFFSNYSLPPHKVDPRLKIKVLNEKLDALTRETLSNQMNNLKILAQVNEIKGLIVDLMSS